MKICPKCNKNKELCEFHTQKSSKDGLYPYCKTCRAEKDREYNKINRLKIQIRRKKYRERNKEAIYVANKIYSKHNKEKISANKKRYYAENRKIIRRKNYDYIKKRREESIQVRIRDNIRKRVREAAIYGKVGSQSKCLGCSSEELMAYLESKFCMHPKTGKMMTWENYGRHGWHIDHIKPLASFDLTNREQFLEACHYTNLQPLWAEENLRKGSKIIKEDENVRL